MSLRTTYILFGVLGALLVVLGLVLYFGPTPSSTESYVFPSMHDKANPLLPEKIERVEIEQRKPSGPTIVFERQEGKGWRITAPRALPANAGHVDQLLSQMYSAERDKDFAPKNFKEAGLDDPQRVIKFSKGNRTLTLTVGGSTVESESAMVYVSSSDRPKEPLAVSKRDLTTVFEPLAFFRNQDVFGTNTADIKAVTLSQGKTTLAVEKEGDYWWVTGGKGKSDADFEPKLRHLTDVRVAYTDAKNNDFVKDQVSDKELSQYSLAPSQSPLRIVVRREEDKKTTTTTLVVGVAKKVDGKADEKKDKARKGLPDDAAGKYYAYVDDGKSEHDVVKVPAAEIDPLLKVVSDPTSLRSKDLVRIQAPRVPLAIVVNNSVAKMEFLRPDENTPWKLFVGGKEHGADADEVKQLISTLTARDQVQAFSSETKELGDVLVKVYTEGVEKADKKGGRPTLARDARAVAVLRFAGQPEKARASIWVRRSWGDYRTMALVPDTVYKQVEKRPLAYYDRKLPSYEKDGGEVTKLVIERDGVPTEVKKDKKSGEWKMERPASAKGRAVNALARERVLDELNRLRALELKASKATPEELKNTYKVTAPDATKVTVTVTKDGKDTTTEYAFGKKEGAGVYAKVSGDDTIYFVPVTVLDQLGKDLQDPTIFTFEPSNVKAVKIRGWKELMSKVALEPVTKEYVRKDNGWEDKASPKTAINAANVESFLADLSSLKAERFLGTAPTAAEKLRIDQDALDVQVTVVTKDDKGKEKTETYQVRLGGPEGTTNWYATSKQFAEGKEAFTVAQKEALKSVRQGFVYFTRKE